MKTASHTAKRKSLETVHERRLRFFPKTYGNPKYTHLQQESLLREGIARKFILPRAKKIFGKNLLAVVLFGSSQVGVRKSWSSSDLDFIVVVKNASDEEERLFDNQQFKVARHFGVVPHKLVYTQSNFIQTFQPSSPSVMPFQIIYWAEYVKNVAPYLFLVKRRNLVGELREGGRYDGRR